MSDARALAMTVIGGYLGAGKTTLINTLLAEPGGRRYGVIVNDIGEVNIDASLIDHRADNVLTLTNGCVCCSVVDGFAEVLAELRAPERALDHVIVEVSGVGDPWKVAQWGRTPGFELESVVVLADLTSVRERARDPYVGDTVLGQLRSGDVVVATKSDLAADGGAAAVTWLRGVTDAPVLVATEGARSILDLVGATDRALVSAPLGAHADHQVWTVTAATSWPRSRWVEWVQAAPDWVVRVKGFVPTDDGLLLLQRVGRRSEVTRWRGGPVQPTIVVVATSTAGTQPVQQWLREADLVV